MTIEMINEILNGTFTDEADKIYWINKRNELIRKANNAKENEKYFKKMAKYNR